MSNNSFSVTGPPGFSAVFKGIPSYIGRSLVSFSNRIARTYHFAGREIDVCGVNNVVDDVDISFGATVIANRPNLSCVTNGGKDSTHAKDLNSTAFFINSAYHLIYSCRASLLGKSACASIAWSLSCLDRN